MNTTKSMVMEALRSRYIAREREDTVEFLTAVESGTPVNIDKLDWLIRRIMVAATAREVRSCVRCVTGCACPGSIVPVVPTVSVRRRRARWKPTIHRTT